ncbi:hypothetical protein HF086_009903 [Spodoptera exigua]|uniref:Peptidase S8 pro-domain domain-containing protein n=1 Tax=Spodoptera exigua TaxID=7107 RepID=A0A922S9A6_SPOEX|nr:hypothetical protein HF086_009903 [Spodoptera exigua]
MVTLWRALALLAALHACVALPEPVYHDQFAVHVPAGPHHVDDIARRHGFVNHGQIQIKNIFDNNKKVIWPVSKLTCVVPQALRCLGKKRDL